MLISWWRTCDDVVSWWVVKIITWHLKPILGIIFFLDEANFGTFFPVMSIVIFTLGLSNVSNMINSNFLAIAVFMVVVYKTIPCYIRQWLDVQVQVDFCCRHGKVELARFQYGCRQSRCPWASEVATTGALQRRPSCLWAHRGVRVQQKGTTVDFVEWW